MKIGPKYKICKRLGSAVFEKCQTQKFAVSEARSAKNKGRRGPVTDYGLQLLEKQKARYTYGLTEKQFSRYVNEAMQSKGLNPAQTLFEKLEKRLDNVIYRMGLAKTRRMARQLVSHGHVKVNDRKVTIPSFTVSEGDEIAIKNKDKGVFTELEEVHKHYNPPVWVSFDPKKAEGKIAGAPVYEPSEHVFSLSRVIEFYSR